MSDPVYPENALPDDDPNPEGEDVDPDLVAVGEQAGQGPVEPELELEPGPEHRPDPEDRDEADFDGSDELSGEL